jgi:hypothetical protein
VKQNDTIYNFSGAVSNYNITFGSFFQQTIDCTNSTNFARNITLPAIGFGEQDTLTILATSIYNETLSLVTPVTGVANRILLDSAFVSPTGFLPESSSLIVLQFNGTITVCNETTNIVLNNLDDTVLQSSTTSQLSQSSMPGPGTYPVSATLTTDLGFITINRTVRLKIEEQKNENDFQVTIVGSLANLSITAMLDIDSLSASSTSVSTTITNDTTNVCGVLLPGDQSSTLVLNVGSGKST